MKPALSSIALLLAALTLPVQAVTVALSPDKDNTIYQESPTFSNGGGNFIFAGTRNGGAPRRSLLSFDVASAVPAGATINSAVLRLTLSNPRSTGASDINLHRLTADWGEGTTLAPRGEGAGAASSAGDATWASSFQGTSSWTTAGGDFLGGASATTSVNANGPYEWSGLASDAQTWLDNSAQNFGWILVGDESTSPNAKRFHSSENTSGQPLLTIDYTPIPEPSSALLGILGLGLLARRRR